MLRPSAPPITRQLAYQTGGLLIDVEGDPQGWYTLPPVTIRGTVFSSRAVEFKCTVSVNIAWIRHSLTECIPFSSL